MAENDRDDEAQRIRNLITAANRAQIKAAGGVPILTGGRAGLILFPPRPETWPADVPGHKFLARAWNELGAAMVNAGKASGDGLEDARKAIRDHCQYERLKAVVMLYDGSLFPVAAHRFNVEESRHWILECYMRDREVFAHGGSERRWLYIESTGLADVIGDLQSPATRVDRSPKTKHSAEKVDAWAKSVFLGEPVTRNEFQRRGLEQFKGISTEQIRKVWERRPHNGGWSKSRRSPRGA
jgi:hypothetical protein